MGKIMGEMQYVKLGKKDKEDTELMAQLTPLRNGLFGIKYRYKDMFGGLIGTLYKVCCCRCGSSSKAQALYQRGYRYVEKDLSTFEIMKTIKKFKAVLAYIVKDKGANLKTVRALLVR